MATLNLNMARSARTGVSASKAEKTNISRTVGPWDEADVDFTDGVKRVDLGGLRIPAVDGIQMRLQVDEVTNTVMTLVLALEDGAVEVQPFAAPRSGGMWDGVRPQIVEAIESGGGTVYEVEGPFGIELVAQVNHEDEDGSIQLVPSRYVGADGPRWFMRFVFYGAGVDPASPTACALEEVVRGIAVIRGREALPVGAQLPLKLPEEASS